MEVIVNVMDVREVNEKTENEKTEREAWLAERKKGIGASDAAAILGLSPWGTPFSVYLDKSGKGEPFVESDAMRWGRVMESAIAELYMNREGRRMVKGTKSIPHPLYPEIRCTPDFIDEDDKDAPILEVKYSPYGFAQWGAEGTDDIPQNYIVQCAVMMEVLDRDQCDIAVSFGKPEIGVYHIRRDRELGGAIIDKLRAWWKKHIVEGVEPEVDGSVAAKNYIISKFPANRTPLKAAAANEDVLMAELALLDVAEKLAAKRIETIKNELRFFIGDADGLIGTSGRVCWKKAKDGVHPDWEGAFKDLTNTLGIGADELKEIMERHTSIKPGVRRFLFTPSKLCGGK